MRPTAATRQAISVNGRVCFFAGKWDPFPLDDTQRVEKLARIRLAFEQGQAGVALFFADELDISLRP